MVSSVQVVEARLAHLHTRGEDYMNTPGNEQFLLSNEADRNKRLAFTLQSSINNCATVYATCIDPRGVTRTIFGPHPDKNDDYMGMWIDGCQFIERDDSVTIHGHILGLQDVGPRTYTVVGSFLNTDVDTDFDRENDMFDIKNGHGYDILYIRKSPSMIDTT
jgi:hypothetical protein